MLSGAAWFECEIVIPIAELSIRITYDEMRTVIDLYEPFFAMLNLAR